MFTGYTGNEKDEDSKKKSATKKKMEDLKKRKTLLQSTDNLTAKQRNEALKKAERED